MARKMHYVSSNYIFTSHASTANLEEMERKNNFVVRREANHIKEKDRCFT
jgi:hypothetical protein